MKARAVTLTALTALALCAFAGNSVLCRLALREGAIDPWSFTALRLVSGALLLAPLLLRRRGDLPAWRPAGGLALAAYAAAFSLAYVSLPAGTGALLLFGTVQLTMFAAALRRGERLSPLGAAGVVAEAIRRMPSKRYIEVYEGHLVGAGGSRRPQSSKKAAKKVAAKKAAKK